MVLGWSKRDESMGSQQAASFAWRKIAETQHEPRMPCLLVPQPAHAVLAGGLAGALLPEAFGELPQEIIDAVVMHDTGWALIDAEQIRRLRSDAERDRGVAPVSFLATSPEEAVGVWTRSIDHVERSSAAGGLTVSRHFSYLAEPGEGGHQKFITAERSRQRRLEAATRKSASDLARWTAVLGFCDLLSLYLITGLKGAVSLPLAHPSSPEAQTAPRVTLRLEEQILYFSPKLFVAGFNLALDALKHPIPSGGARTERLNWTIA